MSNFLLYLIAELDRTLKKIEEGIVTFNEIWKKVWYGIGETIYLLGLWSFNSISKRKARNRFKERSKQFIKVYDYRLKNYKELEKH